MDTIVSNRSIKYYRRNFNRANIKQQANKKYSGIIENFVRKLSSVCGFIAQIIVFDEPTSTLDLDTRDSINKMIFELDGYTRIVVTHDRREEYLN